MKKLLALLLTFALIFTLAGCRETDSSAETSTTEETVETGNQPVRQKPLAAVSLPATTVTESTEDGTVIFRQTTQHMQLTTVDSDVAEKVVLDFLNRVDQSSAYAQQLKESAVSNQNDPEAGLPYEYSLRYEPQRIDQGILSLYGIEMIYNGGSHPNYHCKSANYELITGEPLTLGSILVHENALPSLKALLLAQLNAISKETLLWDNYKDTVNKRFESDESFDEDWFFTATGLCFYFAPYEIASYATGIVLAEIPYEKLTGIMDDAFFPAEQETAEGTVSVTALNNADLSEVTQIAELILDPEAESYLLRTDQGVRDLRILCTDPDSQEVSTPFAMQQLTFGDAVRLQVDAETAKQLSISYVSGGKTVTTPLS